MNPRISIIVPVYRAEKFLNRCVDSVFGQTFPDWELILVDDGSPDRSGELCDAFAARDGRVRVIHQENAGVSAARNAGIEAARGEYIGFVDADDRVAPSMFADLMTISAERNAEVTVCDTWIFQKKKTLDTISSLRESVLLTHADFTPPVLMEMAGSACKCLYAASLIREKHIRFPVGIKLSEDRVFNLCALGYAQRVFYVKTPYYECFAHEESAVHRFHADYFETCRAAARATKAALVAAWENDAALQDAYLGQFVGGAFGSVNNYFYKTSTLSRKERFAAVRRLCGDEGLRDAVKRSGIRDRRADWIMKKRVLLLTLYAIAANKKHGR